jgi:hypothetical protein
MYYFAYGSNMFTYRLEKRVGKVSVRGVAKLAGHRFICNKLSVDGSLKADALATGQDDQFILGIVFDINPANKPLLDKEEGLGNGCKIKNVTVEIVESGKKLDIFTYVTEHSADTNSNAPYKWYMSLIIAGAEEHKLPAEYTLKLKDIPTKNDDHIGRNDVNLFLLKEGLLPRKSIGNAMDIIADLSLAREFTVSIEEHVLNNRRLYYKGDNDYTFETTSPIQKGVNTNKELELRDKTVVLEKETQKWVVKGQDFLIDQVSYDMANNVKILTGRLNAFSTKKNMETHSRWYRFIMPLQHDLKNYKDYEASGYVENYKLFFGGLLRLTIAEKPYHFYSYVKNKIPYAIIDSMEPVSLHDFKRACHCILLTSTFLSGTMATARGYFFAYDHGDMEFPLGVLYQCFSERENNQMPVFTTNPYTGIKPDELERDESGGIAEQTRKKLYDGMIFFPQKVFSNICDLTFKNNKLLRSLLLWGINQSASLELKLGVQYILLETLSAVIVTEGNVDMKLVKDPNLARELVEKLNATLNEFCSTHAIAPKDLNPMYRKIANINSPPNMDKLGKAFVKLKYKLSDEEKKILTIRNKFLHGSIPTLGEGEIDFKELFHLSLRMHFLIALLILKHAGFVGKIINYAKIHEGITGKFVQEERLVKI